MTDKVQRATQRYWVRKDDLYLEDDYAEGISSAVEVVRVSDLQAAVERVARWAYGVLRVELVSIATEASVPTWERLDELEQQELLDGARRAVYGEEQA